MLRWLLADFMSFRPEFLGIVWWNCLEENLTNTRELPKLSRLLLNLNYGIAVLDGQEV